MSQQTQKLTDFLASLDHVQPMVHDELTRSLLKRKGWLCKETKEDIRLQRFVSLAAQKFIASISHESLQIYKQRRKQTQTRLKDQGLKDQKSTLHTEDLAEALQEYGVNLKPAPYFVDGPAK